MTDKQRRMLDEREELARRRIRAAAAEVRRAALEAGMKIAREHPWALPSAGFFAGVLAPWLVPVGRHDSEENGHDCGR